MSSGTDRVREVLKQQDYPSGGSRGCVAAARRELKAKSQVLLALAIKQHESLRGEHMRQVYNIPWHLRAVENRDYPLGSVNAAACPECLVLLQWEQMWKEEA